VWVDGVCHLAHQHQQGRRVCGLQVLTLKTDHRYWPTSQLVLDKCSGEWTRQAIGSLV
jgi:hypothetical protein